MSSFLRYLVSTVLGTILIGLFGFGVSRALAGQWGPALPIFGLSILAGAIVLYVVYAMRQDAAASSAEKAGRADKPWTVRPEWRSDTLTHEEEVEWGGLVISVLSGVGVGIVGGFVIYGWSTRPSAPLWLPFIGLLFLSLATYVAYAGVQKFRRQYRFSESRLELDTMPGCLGTPLRGRVYAPIERETMSEHEVTVKLTCKRRYQTMIAGDPARRRRRSRTVTKWADEARVAGTPRLRKNMVLEVPIEFDLPEDPPPSTPEKKQDRILWELRVAADLPSVDYEATFEIPVFEPDAVPSARQPDEADRSVSDAAYHRQRESAVEKARSEASSSTSSRSSTSDTGAIDVEGRPSEGLHVRIGAGGDFSIVGFPLFIGFVFGGMGAAMLAGGTAKFQLMSIVALLLGVPLLYVGLRRLTYSGEVIVENGQVTVHSGPFGFWQTQTFPCAQLEEATVKSMGHTGDASNYVFVLETEAPSDSDASPTGHEAAEKVFESADAKGAQEMLKKTANWDRQIKVGEALRDKPAADRVANAIVEAAEQQASA